MKKAFGIFTVLLVSALFCFGASVGHRMIPGSKVIGPSASSVDDFNRSNEDPLTTTNWYGNPWTSYPDYTMKVVSNQAVGEAGGYTGAIWKNLTATNMEVVVPVTTLPASGGVVVLLVRHNNSTHTGYECEFTMKSASTISTLFYRWDNGSTGITAFRGNVFGGAGLSSISAGDLLACQIIGSQLSAWIYHDSAWRMMHSQTEGTYTSSGLAGFGTYEGTTTATFTDFRAKSLD